jgi:CDP-paratose 2-epimerase
VRDNLASVDLVRAFLLFHESPRAGAVYNLGGGRISSCSMLEAIASSERIAGKPLDWTLSDEARTGDHRWWISDLAAFQADYPTWAPTLDTDAILRAIHDENAERWSRTAVAA